MPTSLENQRVVGTVTPAKIVSKLTGGLGETSLGFPILPPVGAGLVPELVSCHLSYQFSVAAYGAGGAIHVNLSSGDQQSESVDAAQLLGGSSNVSVLLRPLPTTNGTPTRENTGLNLVADAAFTQPGTAAGYLKYDLQYRVRIL
jgi:hypothetical protein